MRAYILAAMTFMQVLLDYGFNSFGTKAIAECSSDRARIGFETSRIVLLRGALVVVGAVLLAAVTPFVTIMAENPAYVAIAYAVFASRRPFPISYSRDWRTWVSLPSALWFRRRWRPSSRSCWFETPRICSGSRARRSRFLYRLCLVLG